MGAPVLGVVSGAEAKDATPDKGQPQPPAHVSEGRLQAPAFQPQEDRQHYDRREHILPRFSLDRRITVLVLLATVLVVGTIAALGIPLELLPRGFDEPWLNVQTFWQDAPAQEVLDKVILPLEEELSTVPGVQDLFSFSMTGFGRVSMSFKLGSDMDVTYREVRDRVERAKARLPAEVDRVLIRKHSEGSIPLLAMGLAVDAL